MVVLPRRQKNSLGERFTLRADGQNETFLSKMFWPATLSKSDLLKTSCMIFPEALKQVFSRAPKDSTQVLLISAVFKSFV